MNQTEKASLRMLLKLKDFFAMYSAILATVSGLSVFLGNFSSILTSILAYISLQSLDKKGANASKVAARAQLSILIEDTSNRLYTYAMVNNNINLMAEAKHSEKSLKRLSEAQFYGAAQSMYDRTQSNLAALATSGITAATQTALQTAINNYVAFIPKPEESFFDKKQTSGKLEDLFVSAMQNLKKIDRFMKLLKYTQPAVYTAYLDARKVIEKGSRQLAMKCRALDSMSKIGIEGCKFSLVLVLDAENQKVEDAEAIIVKTAEKGGAYIKSLEVGTYEVKVGFAGYQEQNLTVVYSGNEMINLEVLLVATDHDSKV